MSKINIAITGLDARENPFPGLAVARCLASKNRDNFHLVGLTFDVLSTGAYAHPFFDKIFRVPFPGEGETLLLQRIEEIHKEEQIHVLIPTLDSEVPMYARLESRLRKMGIATLLPSETAVKMRSKMALQNFCRENRIPAPRTKTITSLEGMGKAGTDLGYPLFLKGSIAGAHQAFTPIQANLQFLDILHEWGYPILAQERIEGEEIDLAALANRQHQMIGAVGMKKLGVTWEGKACSGVTIEDPDLYELGAKIIQDLKWIGPLELEFIKEASSGRYFLVEINSRFPAWIYLCTGAGQNLPFAAMELALGREVPPFPKCKSGTLFHRGSGESSLPISVLGSFGMSGELDLRAPIENKVEIS